MNEYQPPAVKQSNGMGLAGFIIGLIGFVSCGLLSPIGLVFSIIGLTRQPKGFAIAGLVFSLLGMGGCIIGLLAFGLTLPIIIFGAIAGGLGIAAIALIAIGQNAIEVVEAIDDYHEANSVIPATLDDLNLPAETLRDHWGNEFVYLPHDDGDTFLLISAGQDGQIANSDDVVGRISLASGFSVSIKTGYDDINRSEWPNLPAPPQPDTPPAEAETDPGDADSE